MPRTDQDPLTILGAARCRSAARPMAPRRWRRRIGGMPSVLLLTTLLLSATGVAPAAWGQEAQRQDNQRRDEGPRQGLVADGQGFRIGDEYFADLLSAQLSPTFQHRGLRCGTPRRAATPEIPTKNAGACGARHTKILPQHGPNSGPLLRIPVVVHIVHRGDGVGRLPEALIHSQLEVLQEDFRALAYSPGSGGIDTRIELKLASIDPTGSATRGILYYENDGWHEDPGAGRANPMMAALAWDPKRFLNLFVNDAGGSLGYATSPHHGAGTAADGVVLHYSTVGRDNPDGGLYDQGRTATHEIGHYLGLFHTFHEGCGLVDDPYGSGDLIADTPAQSEPNWHCASSHASCGSSDADDNYMNYTEDRCMAGFSREQVHRMRCVLATYRPHLGTIDDTGFRELAAGVPERGLAAGTGEEVHFRLRLPPGVSSLTVAIDGGGSESGSGTSGGTGSGTGSGEGNSIGDADLYLRRGAAPDATTWDCRPYRNGSTETCALESPPPGLYFVTLRAYQAFSNVSLVAHWSGGDLVPNRPPEADVDIRHTGLAIALEDRSTDSDGRILERRWSFGDGTELTFGDGEGGSHPLHVYAEAGTYTVRLEVVDDDGAAAVVERVVRVTGELWGASSIPFVGTLEGVGDWRAEPGGAYYGAPAGRHQLRLTVPGHSTYVLQLYRWQRHWQQVATVTVPCPGPAPRSAQLDYRGETGYYYARIVALEGSGPYLLEIDAPLLAETP